MDINKYRQDIDDSLKEAIEDMKINKASKKTKRAANNKLTQKEQIENLTNTTFLLCMVSQRLAVYVLKNSISLGIDTNQVEGISDILSGLNTIIEEVFPNFQERMIESQHDDE